MSSANVLIYVDVISNKQSIISSEIRMSSSSINWPSLVSTVAQAVQPHQRQEAKEQWHNDIDPLDARSRISGLSI